MISSFHLSKHASFRHDLSTLEQVTRMSQDIKNWFEDKKNIGAVFVNISDAYDTVWHCGLVCKLLHLLPDRHMIKITMEHIL